MTQLAQQWPGPLIDGFVTLSAADATAQGLEPAQARLPEARGRLRNAAYAGQWWLFAAFTLVMAVRMARDLRLEAATDAPELSKADRRCAGIDLRAGVAIPRCRSAAATSDAP